MGLLLGPSRSRYTYPGKWLRVQVGQAMCLWGKHIPRTRNQHARCSVDSLEDRLDPLWSLPAKIGALNIGCQPPTGGSSELLKWILGDRADQGTFGWLSRSWVVQWWRSVPCPRQGHVVPFATAAAVVVPYGLCYMLRRRTIQMATDTVGHGFQWPPLEILKWQGQGAYMTCPFKKDQKGISGDNVLMSVAQSLRCPAWPRFLLCGSRSMMFKNSRNSRKSRSRTVACVAGMSSVVKWSQTIECHRNYRRSIFWWSWLTTYQECLKHCKCLPETVGNPAYAQTKTAFTGLLCATGELVSHH